MRFRFFYFILIISLTAPAIAQNSNVYFIKYKSSVTAAAIDEAISSKSILISPNAPQIPNTVLSVRRISENQQLRNTALGRIIIVQLNSSLTEAEFRDALIDGENIEYIETNKRLKLDAIPNDSLWAEQWTLRKIDIQTAWDITLGADSVVIGLIDTGIDYLHPDLKNKIWLNQGEIGNDSLGRDKRMNGIDDDGNGFTDDWRGWDFTDRAGFPYDSTGGDYLNWDNDPMDDNIYSHGTSVAGIMAAETNNLLGIAGVAPHIKILNLRAFDPDGFGEEDDVAAALLYAVQMNAKVINMSFGDESFSLVLRDIIQYAYEKNLVLVGSSGNSGSANPHYPSGYSEVISVGNSTPEDYVASSSNYGSTLDLVAPGTGIITTHKGYSYTTFSGTSAAAPFASAAAALLLSIRHFSNEEIRQILKTSSDDIGESGWDLRSGAGRLNIGNALRSLAPATIRFDYPSQDFATTQDTMRIVATILSPSFSSYNLSYGFGLNPISWVPLAIDQKNQIYRKRITSLDIHSIRPINDTVLTLRIQLIETNGRTFEERINTHIIRNAPGAEPISLFPAYYGSVPTISAAVYSSQNSICRMFFRRQGETNFSLISLDGFASNNFFIKKLHYGFIPLQIAQPSTTYQIYFEVENLAGLKTIIKDTSGAFFIITTDDVISNEAVTQLPYSLPQGLIYPAAVLYSGTAQKNILLNRFNDLSKTYSYSFSADKFTLTDSLSQRIVKDVGDFNGDGLTDILANWGRNGYIISQNVSGSSKMIEKFKRENDAFWPILASDIDNNSKTEILAVTSDTTITVSELSADFSLTLKSTLRNFSRSGFGGNVFDYPSALVTDLDRDGKKELWIMDTDGDALCYNVISSSQIVPDTLRSFSTGFVSSSSYITSGDFNGDGIQDLAIILHSVDNIDVAQFHLVYIVSFISGKLTVLFEKAFIDPSSEFNVFTRKSYNSIKLAKLFSSNKDDLALALFPYGYLFTFKTGSSIPVFYRENINSSSVFTGDLNANGVNEFGLSMNDSLRFFEFSSSLPAAPNNLTGYSVDSAKIRISWTGNGIKYFVFRGVRPDSLALIDSTDLTYYIDNIGYSFKNYYFRIKARGNSGLVSDFSDQRTVNHHAPAQLLSARAVGNKNLFVSFSAKMNPAVYNLKTYFLTHNGNIEYPEIIVPANEYSFLVTFKERVAGISYTLKTAGLSDFWGAPIQDDSAEIIFQPPVIDSVLYIESFAVNSPYEVALNFNLPLDTASAMIKTNYKYEPSMEITSVRFNGNSSKSIIITGNKPVGSVGIEYVLNVSNLRSTVSSGFVPSKNGSGSVIKISQNAGSLSDVYTYPNPVTRINNDHRITFANLPRYAEITVFDLQGKKLKTLIENNGDGGLDWNLIDDEGNEIGSGIYMYLVRQLNEQNEETAVQLFKFSVVR